MKQSPRRANGLAGKIARNAEWIWRAVSLVVSVVIAACLLYLNANFVNKAEFKSMYDEFRKEMTKMREDFNKSNADQRIADREAFRMDITIKDHEARLRLLESKK